MYEQETFQTIIDRMMERVDRRFNKREGSIIYDSNANSAIEHAKVFSALDTAIQEFNPITSSREFLESFAKVFGYFPYEATNAVVRMQVEVDEGIQLDFGERFNLRNLNYSIIDYENDQNYLLECETPGTEANDNFGQCVPMETIKGLKSCEITELVIPGEDLEDTEVFRERFLGTFSTDRFGGNREDYIYFVNEIEGVGGCKCARCPEGPGTVHVYIIDSRYRKPTEELLAEVQKKLQPKEDTFPEMHTCGLGIAPIGHEVTVFPVTEKTINVGLSLTFNIDYTFERLKSEIQSKIEEYFDSVRKQWAKTDRTVIRVSEIVNVLLDIEGILDVSLLRTTLNNQTENIVMGEYEIPVLGEIEQSQEVVDPDHCNCPDCQLNYQCKDCPRMTGA